MQSFSDMATPTSCCASRPYTVSFMPDHVVADVPIDHLSARCVLLALVDDLEHSR